MTTTQDLIAQLRALGIPDWAMARVLMTQAADTLEALQAAVARLETLAKGQHAELYNARLRLAESEAQNLMARQIILEHGEGVTGASPVEPLTKTQIEKGMMALLWCAASDLERLNPNMYEGYKDDVTRVYSAITTETTRNS